MTATRDPDRILRAWLDVMPDDAPDRLYRAVLDEIDFTPQVRRPWAAGRWRVPTMPRIFLAGAAVALAIVVGAIVLAPRPSPNVGVSTTPSPSDSAAASATPAASDGAAAADVPAGLRHRWMGASNGLVTVGAGSSIVLTSSNLALTQSNSNETAVLTAGAGAEPSGRLRLSTEGPAGVCAPGTVGLYEWSLSPSGRVLNINTADDPCPERTRAIVGTWWLSSCKDVNDDCLGPMDAGTYASQFINFREQGPKWQPRFGSVTYAVPDGWANDADWPASLGLSPQSAYDEWTREGGTPRGLNVLANVAADATDRPCAGTPASGVANTSDAILAALRTVPGLVPSDSAPITVDGHAGAWVDLAVDDATLRPCDGGERIVEYLVSSGEGQALRPGERARVVVLAGVPTPLAIVIQAPAADFDALVPPAMRIVKSMQFK
jgi:hypothetical protein